MSDIAFTLIKDRSVEKELSKLYIDLCICYKVLQILSCVNGIFLMEKNVKAVCVCMCVGGGGMPLVERDYRSTVCLQKKPNFSNK